MAGVWFYQGMVWTGLTVFGKGLVVIFVVLVGPQTVSKPKHTRAVYLDSVNKALQIFPVHPD